MSKKENNKVLPIVNIKQKVKGVTLIALVVTIVVLIILASVTISLTFKQNGLFGKAKKAVNSYEVSEANESDEINDMRTRLTRADTEYENEGEEATPTVAEIRETKTLATDNTKVIDEKRNTVWVPKGFNIVVDSPTQVSKGIVISDVAGDDLANSKGGNQYVWIPCTIDGANGSIKYDRYAFAISGYEQNKSAEGAITEGGYNGNFTESMDTVEQTSIIKYEGFYIGKYEAGISSARTAKGDTTKMTMADLGEVLEKKALSYTYVTRDQAKSLAEEISSHYGYNVTSKLCSSYAWDTALKFIDKTNSGYSTNSTQGNYKDLSFTYKDMSGASQTKAANTGTVIPTGATTAVCNIYDMGGNVWEWTTEAYSESVCPYVDRGGVCGNTSSGSPASDRSNYFDTDSSFYLGFRPTLYL